MVILVQSHEDGVGIACGVDPVFLGSDFSDLAFWVPLDRLIDQLGLAPEGLTEEMSDCGDLG